MDTTMDLGGIRLLQNRRVIAGEKWLYIADFNIKLKNGELQGTDRVDAEIEDLQQIRSSGGIAIILAHKGRYGGGDNGDLDHVAPYLSGKLGCLVQYYPDNATEEAVQFVQQLEDGAVAIMGNTRKHAGEEKNDPELARVLARLGDRVAVGGFGKAHREHASNVGILEFLPGYATRSQIREAKILGPWAGKSSDRFSVAVLGGIKKEKITIGLKGLAETYDAIIPGGIVLHTVLKAGGSDIGQSVIADGGKTFEGEVSNILAENGSERVLLPRWIIVARRCEHGFEDLRAIDLERESVPAEFMIVSYILPDEARVALRRVAQSGGRLLVAGTPDIYSEGLGLATAELRSWLRETGPNAVVLGGDTVTEIAHDGPSSTGGGSALYYAANGTTPVIEALRRNAARLPD